MDRHFYMELFPLSHSMPCRAANGLGTVPFVPKCHLPLPTAMVFLLTLAPSSASLAFTHQVLVPAFTGASFFLELNQDVSKCCH